MKVCERPVAIDEIIAGCKSGALKEMFASGTAAVISPVGEIGYKGEDFKVSLGRTGGLSQKLYDHITGVQYGHLEDAFGWRLPIA